MKHSSSPSSSNDEPDDEMANFVNKLKRRIGRYQGKLPLKCFHYGNIGHLATKFPLKNKNKKERRDKGICSKKRSLYFEIRDDSTKDDEEGDNDRNEIVFMAMEVGDTLEEENEEVVIDL